MKNTAKLLFLISILSIVSFAQKTKPKTAAVKKPPVKTAAKTAPKPAPDEGKVAGRTYTNEGFDFEITFPDSWLIPGKDFEAYMLSQGFDLRVKPPTAANPKDQAALKKAADRVKILLTAYRSMPGLADNAIMRVSVENLSTSPQIKDAVDYFDAMRASFRLAKLPADFTFSETNAEQLGSKQFGFIDVSASDGKKRMYATVKNGYAIMFTLSYTKEADLQTMREILSNGDFALKK